MSRIGRVAVAAAWTVSVSAAPAAASAPRSPVVWRDLTLSAAAIQPFKADGSVSEYTTSVGFGEVRLSGYPACMATGAGYWLGQEMERDGLVQPAYPHRYRQRNPTAANVVRPQPPSDGSHDWRDTAPRVPGHGSRGMRGAAACAQDGQRGGATGALSAGPGPQLGGAAVAAAFDSAGTFVGTARSYVQGLRDTTAGALESFAGLVQVRLAAADAEPTLSYRLTLVRAGLGAGHGATVDSEAVTLAGTDVPAHRLLAQIEEQRRLMPAPWADLATVTLLAPSVAADAQGRLLVTFPAALVRALPGPLVAAADVPRQIQPFVLDKSGAGIRLGSTTFSAHRDDQPRPAA